MFRSFSKQIFKLTAEINSPCNYVLFKRRLSYAAKEYDEKDPAPLFFNNQVQSLLRTLTRVNLQKVYKKRKPGKGKLELPQVKFITDDELQYLMKEAKQRSDELLQIPPVIKVRTQIDKVLSKDPALQGYNTSKHVFTDITFGVENNDRLIVIRDLDGTLREADWDLRDRMNQAFFPSHGRKSKIPLMFKDQYFASLLSRKEYEFILDRACVQFEPDDPEYQKITSATYQHVNENNQFDCLRSTRHFGALAFFLSWFNMIDNLLLELIETSVIEEANILLQLYGKIHGVKFEMGEVENVEKYVKECAVKKASLELALQGYKELEKQNRELREGINKAHGLG